MNVRHSWPSGAFVILLAAGVAACGQRTPEEQQTGTGISRPVETGPAEARTDAGITTAVQARYYRDDLVRGRQIDVSTEHGVVTLEGDVRSEDVRQRAVNLAQEVEGVTRVNDQLRVQQAPASASADTRPRGPGAEDAGTDRATGTAGTVGDRVEAGWITTKIHAQYFASRDVSPFNIDVTTSPAGVVTLAGEVENERQRTEAVRIARETEGVADVVDRLRITGARRAEGDTAAAADREAGDADLALERPDAWLTTKVQAKYFLDGDVKGRNINVDTRDGVVTLTGTVGSEAERRQAVALARNTDGVRSVTDRLQVQAGAAAPDRDEPLQPVRSLDDAARDTRITAAVQSKYFLDDQVKGHEIDVDTANGVVTLKGQVPNDAVRQQAERIARETEGVAKVNNRLTVAP